MFSSRIAGDSDQNAVARVLGALRRRKQQITDLTISNPTTAGFRYPTDITAALADIEGLRYSPDPKGMLQAREAIVAHSHLDIAIENLVLTSSTSEAYSYLFKLLCDPGDEILVPRPSYPLFEHLAQLECVKLKQYGLFYDEGWHMDIADLEAQIGSRTKGLIVVNPNNPTGAFLKRGEYEGIVRVCQTHDLALISDEVFNQYAYFDSDARVQSVAGEEAVLTFALNGLSKLAGLPQMKLAWIAVSGPKEVVPGAVDRLELIVDTFLPVNTPVQIAAEKLLHCGNFVRQQIRARLHDNRALLDKTFEGTAVRALGAEGGWSAILQVPKIRSEEEWVLGLLQQYGVLVQPGYFYDFSTEAFLVLSLLTPEAPFAEGLQKIAAS